MDKREDTNVMFQPRPGDFRMDQIPPQQPSSDRLESLSYHYMDKYKPNLPGPTPKEEEEVCQPYDMRIYQDYSFPNAIHDRQHVPRTGPYDPLQHFPKSTYMQPFTSNNPRRGFNHNKDQNISFPSFDTYPSFSIQSPLQNQRQENSFTDDTCKESISPMFPRHVELAVKGSKVVDEKCPEICGTSRVFTCGGCNSVYNSICKLHDHLDTHIEGGSYVYNHRTRTAFPKFDTTCNSTQTDSEEDISEPINEFNEQTNSIGTFTDLDNEQKMLKVNTDNLNSSLPNVENTIIESVENREPFILQVKEEEKEFSEPEINHYSSETDADVKFEVVEEEKKCRKRKRRKKGLAKQSVPKERKKLRKSKSETSKTSVIKSKGKKVKAEGKTVNCTKCDKVFRFNIELKQHMRSAHTDADNTYCSRCREKFETEAEYLEHKKVHVKGHYECEECHQVLSTAKLLEDHVNRHTGNKPYPCDVCGKAFRTKGQMNFHKKQYHCPSYTQQCEYCGKVFTCRYKMKDHVRYCLGIKPFKCEVCNKGFIRATHLMQHMRIHTGERMYVCDQCGLNLSSQYSLKKHKLTHSGERPFTCDVCSMAFTAKSTLVDHQRTHTQDKRFVCTYCGRSFIKKWNLTTHLRQHTGETPYRCNVCGQGFKQNVLLRTHVRSHEKSTVDQIVTSPEQGGLPLM